MGDRRKCQTYAASPAEPGGLLVMLVLAHMQIPAGDNRQGSAEKMTGGERYTRWPVMDLPSN